MCGVRRSGLGMCSVRRSRGCPGGMGHSRLVWAAQSAADRGAAAGGCARADVLLLQATAHYSAEEFASSDPPRTVVTDDSFAVCARTVRGARTLAISRRTWLASFSAA